MKRWNVRMCDASWILLGATIVLVSLVPAFHRTPWQVALSLDEGWVLMLTASVTLLPALFLYQTRRTTGTIDILRFLPAILAIANVLSIAALMQDSGMIDALGRIVAMGGKNAVWFGGIVVLLALLVGGNVPVIFSIISEWVRKSTRTSMLIPFSPFEMRTKYFYHPSVRWVLSAYPNRESKGTVYRNVKREREGFQVSLRTTITPRS